MSKITLLDVPFDEKDQAKAVGARWNPTLKQWYVPESLDLEPFQKWVPINEDGVETIANAPLYILETYSCCWRCEKNSRVIAIASAGIDDEFSGPLVRVRAKINLHSQALRRPSGKARKRRHIRIFQAFATRPGGMYRRLKM